MCNRNSKYEHVRDSVKGIIFLGTPHRGSDLAALLSNLLWFAFASRKYVDELKKNGSLIELINQHFVDLLTRKSLDIISFWESEDTSKASVLIICSYLVPSVLSKGGAKRLGVDGFRGTGCIKRRS